MPDQNKEDLGGGIAIAIILSIFALWGSCSRDPAISDLKRDLRDQEYKLKRIEEKIEKLEKIQQRVKNLFQWEEEEK